MRAIRTYSFDIKKKIPFSELPAVAHKFLDKEDLSVGRFLYCLESLDLERYQTEKKVNPCLRAVKDCPKLGIVKKLSNSVMFDKLLVDNVTADTECTEADIAPFFKRFERTYGAMDTNFFYYDVDFFGKVLPFLRDRSRLNPNLFLNSDEPCLADQIYGSGICIYRTDMGYTGVELGIDILHEGVLYNPEPYYRSMCELLPGAISRTELRVFLTDEETKEIGRLRTLGEPIIAECSNYLKERLPSKNRQTLSFPNYKIAPVLKKLAKQQSYVYSYTPVGFYELSKRLPRGHFLKIEVISHPSHWDTILSLDLIGLGFKHRLVSARETPENQAELDAWLRYAFSVFAEFEGKYSAELDSLYKETPDWFDKVD
ncbi:MAG: hypothetical protein II191_01830 [Clostridia bacterium]|nr:hypothetical protein [Clostridia bacterium]